MGTKHRKRYGSVQTVVSLIQMKDKVTFMFMLFKPQPQNTDSHITLTTGNNYGRNATSFLDSSEFTPAAYLNAMDRLKAIISFLLFMFIPSSLFIETEGFRKLAASLIHYVSSCKQFSCHYVMTGQKIIYEILRHIIMCDSND